VISVDLSNTRSVHHVLNYLLLVSVCETTGAHVILFSILIPNQLIQFFVLKKIFFCLIPDVCARRIDHHALEILGLTLTLGRREII
jgi:hypothetical protein